MTISRAVDTGGKGNTDNWCASYRQLTDQFPLARSNLTHDGSSHSKNLFATHDEQFLVHGSHIENIIVTRIRALHSHSMNI